MLDLQEDDHFSTKSYDEALAYAEKSTDYEKAQLLFRDLKITDNGELTLQGNPFKISESGFMNLCSTLKIPWGYAKMVPTDQLIFDVNRLSKERELDRLDTYFKPESETIIDMNDNSRLTNISNFAFINKIKEGSRFMFTNHWLKMEIIPENGLEVASVGDIHKIGSSIMHFPTCSSVTQAFMELWTLRCTNGAIAPRSIGREKLNLKSRNDVNTLLEAFIEKVKKMVLSKEELENAFKYLDENMIEFAALKKIDKFIPKQSKTKRKSTPFDMPGMFEYPSQFEPGRGKGKRKQRQIDLFSEIGDI